MTPEVTGPRSVTSYKTLSRGSNLTMYASFNAQQQHHNSIGITIRSVVHANLDLIARKPDYAFNQ